MRISKKAAAAPRRVVGYVRVSTDEQAREGISLDAQEARIRAYAVAMTRDLDEVIIDAGASAKTLQRPGMARIMAGLRDGSIGTVIVVKLDRLTRSVVDLNLLLQVFASQDAALVSMTESLDTASATGRLMLNVMASISQWEREAIGERTATALAHKRSTGKVYGTTPFGYRRDGAALVADDREQAALAEMIAMDRTGASFRAIGAMLDARGVRPHSGKAWHAASVRAVLRSKMALEYAAG